MLNAILLTVHIIVCIALIGVILLQRSEGGAFGTGGGSGGFMTARGAGDLLTRTTAILATLFFVLSLGLTLRLGSAHTSDSLVERMKNSKLAAPAQAPTPAAPTTPSAPAPASPFSAPAPSLDSIPTPGNNSSAPQR